MLASSALGATTVGTSVSGCFTALYCPFSDFSLGFSGTAESVTFTGTVDQSVYDDFTFGPTTVGGGGGVPEPGSGLLVLGGLVIVACLLRRSRQVQPVRAS